MLLVPYKVVRIEEVGIWVGVCSISLYLSQVLEVLGVLELLIVLLELILMIELLPSRRHHV